MQIENYNWKNGLEPFLNYLNSKKDIKYLEFNKKITPGNYEMIGIKIPELRKISKSIYRSNYRSFLDNVNSDIFDIKMIRGLIISEIKDLDEFKRNFDKFLPLIDNWAICDIFISSSKTIKKDLNYFFNRCKSLLSTDDEYKNRVALVILLDYYVIDEYIDRIFDLIKDFKSQKYYANMALAWLLSILYIKYPTETKVFLQNNIYNREIIKMTSRKIKDSYRVKKEDKNWIDCYQKKY